ncbi:MAG TPA: prolyl oligopeptidase family serine peptidase, partial [Phenylobacterium sp.]|nr:prolyl oligopeptidase family serine peptidase [Phenylobacterium sp.]
GYVVLSVNYRGGSGYGLDFREAQNFGAKGAAELAFQSSPLGTIDKWKSPVLLVHADDDRNVPFSQTVQLVEELRQQKVEFEQIVLPDEIHDLLRADSWNRFFHATDDFFARHLQSEPAHR